LHHLPTGTVAAFDHTQDTLDEHVVRAERTAQQITAATDAATGGAAPDDAFPPVPGPSCAWCDFRRHCPAGQQASPELDPWSGLDQPADG
jgi:putative RecB family exonuclease